MAPFKFQNWPGRHLNSLAIPATSSALSAGVLTLQLFFRWRKGAAQAKQPISVLGLSRLAGCFALLALSTQDKSLSHVSPSIVEIGLSLTYIYVLLLALVSIYGRPDNVAGHLTFVLISTLGVYLYRDVLPLCTFFGVPQDPLDGILWVKIGLLSFTGILVPLLAPRRYIPVDPLDSMTVPNPEQTASIISLTFYAFLDPTIILAHRLTRLPYDLLPPLADYDAAKYLRSRNFQHIEQRRHLFWGLALVFRADILILGGTSAFIILSKFAVPEGIRQLLRYIETKGEGASVRPWVWVMWLFLGPTINCLGDQWYMFIVSRMSVRTEAILTELVFEHALRTRATAEPAAKGPRRNLLGRLNNMITTDIRIIISSKRLILALVYMPLMFILSVWFLYSVLGWSAFVGMATIFAMLPVPGYVGKWVQAAQRDLAKKRDVRVQAVTESVNVLRMIKFFGWESKMSAEVADKRQIELGSLWKRKVLDLLNGCLNILLPIITMLATYITYVGDVLAEELTASKVFSSITVFDLFKTSVESILSSYTLYLTSKVSFDRIDDFLRNTEVLDVHSAEQRVVSVPSENQDDIGFHDATFSWSQVPAEDSSARSSSLHIDDLIFKKGCINLILGQTGSGKTSLLLSLLGETYFIPSSPDSWFNLPREGGVAYAAQESWVQSATIKENIVFGAEFDAERYGKVLHQCCLERDLELFAAGDEQVVGERGLTLSGGQKARITLARAVYSQASILLLDDVLAALDVHTAKWIVEKCFRGDLIAGRTVLLVTHNISLMRPVSQFTVALGLDGRVVSQGSANDALEKDAKLEAEAFDDQARLQASADQFDTSSVATEKPSTGGKLMVVEEIMEGSVRWSSVELYLRGLGGRHPVLFFLAVLASMVLQNFAGTLQTWYLGYFSSQYDNTPASEVSVLYYLGIYSSILLFLFFFYACGFLLYTFGILRASDSLHGQLMESVFGTTLRWLDTTPTSRIIARATQDMGMVDGPIATAVLGIADSTVSLAVTFGAIVLFTPVFLGPGLGLFVLGAYCGRLFMPARVSVKREMSNARSPVLGHFAAAVTGITSIRAYGCQDAFIKESLRRLDCYSRCARLAFDLTRWSVVRTDVLSNVFTTAIAVYLVYFRNYNAANTGFSLTVAFRFGEKITHWILRLNDFQLLANNLERIEAYINIEQEPKATKDGLPPAAWPSSGELIVKNLSVRYSEDGPNVLHGISFEIKSGERIGVVGRTGSGKSSLTLALLRVIITEGSVFYDGIETGSINLDALRSKITIIPQMPELLRGTLRQNLDPFGQFEDTELIHALRAAGLFSLQGEGAENKITLDTDISAGGSNFSVGERQVLALARAMIRQSKLLILDEATSAIDMKTDAVIQKSLRTGLGNDVSSLIVAHRLHTVMTLNRIMVLDTGRIIEFDTPQNLLEIKDGHFHRLVDESEDRDALYAMIHEG